MMQPSFRVYYHIHADFRGEYRREGKLPFLPIIGMDIELSGPGDKQPLRVESVSWDDEEQHFTVLLRGNFFFDWSQSRVDEEMRDLAFLRYDPAKQEYVEITSSPAPSAR